MDAFVVSFNRERVYIERVLPLSPLSKWMNHSIRRNYSTHTHTHTQSDRSVAAHHMYLAAAALSLVFTLGIPYSLTDQQISVE